MIKKNTDHHKKSTARRRKQQRLKKRQRSLQQKLARLVKAQRSFNNLVATLIKASASANGSVDPEPEVCHRLPQLRTPAFNINLDSRETPQHVRLQSSVVQRLLSLQATPSISVLVQKK